MTWPFLSLFHIILPCFLRARCVSATPCNVLLPGHVVLCVMCLCAQVPSSENVLGMFFTWSVL